VIARNLMCISLSKLLRPLSYILIVIPFVILILLKVIVNYRNHRPSILEMRLLRVIVGTADPH